MNSPSKNPAMLAVALCGALAMSVVGWKLAEQPSQVPVVRGEDHSPVRPKRVSLPETSARNRVALISKSGSAADRTLATIALADSLTLAEIPAWLGGGWFNLHDGSDGAIFHKILHRRWEAGDPTGHLQWCVSNESGNTSALLASWADKEPERLIGFFKDHPNQAMELQALAAIARNHPPLALGRFLEITGIYVSKTYQHHEYYKKLFQQLARSAPSELDAALDSLPKSLRSSAEIALIGQRLLSSFPEEIRKLWDRTDGIKLFNYVLNHPEGIGDRLLKELGNLPPAWRDAVTTSALTIMIGGSNPESWLGADLEGSGFTSKQAKDIRAHALLLQSKTHPEVAFNRMRDLDLDSYQKRDVIASALAESFDDPEKQASLLALLRSDEEREMANSFLNASRRSEAIKPAKTPAEWLEQISCIDWNPDEHPNYQPTLHLWEQEQINELGKVFKTLPDDQKKQAVVAILLLDGTSKNLYPSLTGEAIRHAIIHPDPSKYTRLRYSLDPIQQASRFAADWATSDPVAASNWVQSLPGGEAKSWAQKNLATVWAQYDPQEARQWVNSLPAGEQDFIKTGGGK